MAKVISCTASNLVQLESMVQQLEGISVFSDQVSILTPEEEIKRISHQKNTKAPEGAAAGVSTGGVIGGVLGLLAGLGSLAIPGIGPLIAAGPILAALSGSALGAAVGGMVGTLVGLGIPEYEAKIYEKKIKEGRIFLSVHTLDSEKEKRDKIKSIMLRMEAEDISEIKEDVLI